MNLIAPTIQPPALRLDPRRKLLPLQFLCIVHALDLEVAIALVEDQAVWFGFNLSTRPDGKRKIHVWRGCVEHFQPGRSSVPKPKLAEVITATLPMLGIAPAASATVRACELAIRFCLKSDTIACLLRAGELREVGKHNPAQESPRVSRSSVVAFLERRVL